MKKIILNNKGKLVAKDEIYFGGKYSILDRIRLGGIGSAKVIYQKGIPYFDELNEFVENEISFVNFELMKNGFIVRLNRNQKLRYVGFNLEEIVNVNLTGTKVQPDYLMRGLEYDQIPYEGSLVIKTNKEEYINFKVSSQYFKAIKTYFEKKVFSGKFDFTQLP